MKKNHICLSMTTLAIAGLSLLILGACSKSPTPTTPRHRLTVDWGMGGNVTVRVNDQLGVATPIDVVEGANVSIVSTTEAGYKFGGWSNNGATNSSIIDNEMSFTMPKNNVTIEAYFAQTSPEAGSIVYADAIYSKEDLREQEHTPIGIAINERLMIALTASPTPLAWGPTGRVTNLPAFATFTEAYLNDTGSGATNSATIAAFGAAANPVRVYPANAYALAYTPTGVTYTQFFLPNALEMDTAYAGRAAINASLALLGNPVMSGLYWTSVQAIQSATPNESTQAWPYDMTPPGRNVTATTTTETLRVLPMAPIPVEPVN